MKDKENLVFLPALMCDHRMYNQQIKYFENKYNVFNFIFTKTTSITRAAELIIKQFKNKSFSLIGTSMGGYIAMEVMKLNSSNVNKIVLISTSWEEDTEERKSYRQQSIEKAKLYKDQVYMVNDDTIKNYIYNFTDNKANIIKIMAKDLGKETLINQQQLIMSRTESIEDLKKYNIPTLFICSEHDKITPVEVHKKMHKAVKDSSLVEIKACGHLSPVDNPQIITKELDAFLKRDNLKL
jgi:pimeloyl-ACP methyl ester carboxylesterase